MSPFADTNPMDLALPHSHPPPPSYQLSQDEFDQKTSHAIGLSSSIYHPIIDEDGWPSYDAAAFEAVAKSYQQGSSSAVPGADVSRHQRQSSGASASLSPATDSMKTRSERRRQNRHADPDYSPEPRLATPPPPFTATGPSLDGPPFDEVVTSSYPGPPAALPQTRPTSVSPVTQPNTPLLLPSPRQSPRSSHRFSDPQTQARTQILSNNYNSYRPPDITSRPVPTSTITRVEFDPQMAYSPYGRNGNHTPMQGGASMFYNHAVASQLGASPTMTTSPQMGYSDSHRFSTSGPLPSAPPMVSSVTLPPDTGYAQRLSGGVRGALPPAPAGHPRWAGSEAHVMQDVYGGNG